MSDIHRIVAFFLNLYRLQNQEVVTPETPTYKQIPSEATTDLIYQLRIRCRNELKTRRMSIRQIGERVESKSTCYKVIYDDPLVVKIPPRPITEFKAYLRDINSQRKISLTLRPSIRCLSPSLSALLKKIPGIIPPGLKTEKEREEACIRLLISQPLYQDYLKIGEGFVFFMELAKESFFNQVISDIHDATSRVQDEILKNGHLFENLNAFEAAYGDDSDSIFFDVNRACTGFEKKIDEAVSRFGGLPPVPDYTKKEWFISILANKEPEISPSDFPERLFSDIHQVFKNMQEGDDKGIRLYRKTVREGIRKKIFDANKSKIEGLIINILSLLYYLKKNAVAARDLKPDNIFVSGNLEGSYRLLATPQAYSLGLIDLETAVIYRESHSKNLKQPLLAGTPSYMTPSHIFKNNILHEVFDTEITRVLYLQDWFAAIGMIYNVTIGKTLFKKTSGLISKIINLMKKAVRQEKPLEDMLKQVSWRFWTKAEDEFYSRISLHREKFSALLLRLPEPIRLMLKNELDQEAVVFKESIKRYSAFKALSSESRNKIIQMPYDALVQYRSGWEAGIHGSGLPQETRERVIRFLKGVERLKRQLKIHEPLHRLLDQPLCGYDLLVFLFNRVMNGMFRPNWTDREPPGREHMIFKG